MEVWKLLVIFLLLFLLTPQALGVMPEVLPEEVGVSSERLCYAEQIITNGLDNNSYPGAVVIAGRHGKIFFSKAYGNKVITPTDLPTDIDTIYDLASLTKIFTATAIMILVERGQLLLSDKVTSFYPRFGRYGKADITIEQLLLHTSGLPSWLALYKTVDSKEAALNEIFYLKPEAKPNEAYIYSDLGYMLLGFIIEKITQTTVDDFIKKEILLPLKMNNSMYNPPPELKERCAATEYDHVFRKRLIWGEVHDENAYAIGGASGHAGLFSTASDMARFCQMFLNLGELEGARILSPLTVMLMTQNHISYFLGVQRGYGWYISTSLRGDIFPLGSYGHTGFTGTSIWIDPFTDSFSIILTNRVHPNRDNNTLSTIRSKFHNPLAAAIVDLFN